jgi:hypothetical protein
MRQSKSTGSFAALLKSRGLPSAAAAAADAAAVRDAGRVWPTKKEDYELVADCGAGVRCVRACECVCMWGGVRAGGELHLRACEVSVSCVCSVSARTCAHMPVEVH